jgi:hypothetical protein
VVVRVLQVEQWAAAPVQVLLLADAIMWTKAATGSLQQLTAGNSRALRSLFDAASLRLETVSAVLRGQRPQVKQASGQGPGAAAAAAATEAATQAGRSNGAREEVPVRPLTPDTSDDMSVKASPWGVPEAHAPPGSSSSGGGSQRQGSSERSAAAANSSSKACSGSVRQGLSQQQILGLQALASAAACHRDIAAALVAADVEGVTAFEWDKQLRHSWDAQTQELKVWAHDPLLLVMP